MIKIKLGVNESKSPFHWVYSFFKKKVNPTVLVLYNDIKETPSWKGNEFHKYAMYDLGVGSTVEDFNAHFSKLHAYLGNKKTDEAIQEMTNLHNCYFNIIENINTKSVTLCSYIKSIDGKDYVNTDIDDHIKTLEYLGSKGLKTKHCPEIINDIKKKMLTNFDFTLVIGSMGRDKLMQLVR